MDHKLAFLTVGILHEAFGNARVQGFVDRIPAVYGAADLAEGFVARSFRDIETFQHSWGPLVPPACFPPLEDKMRLAMTLSLWEDLESVAAFAYRGSHGEALTKRKEWFESHGLPTYVAWWVSDGHQIDWQEGADRLDCLHMNGPTKDAFNFAAAFDAAGNPCPLDSDVVKSKVDRNVAKLERADIKGPSSGQQGLL